jgi:coenzyme F420-reducing hydrogenase gamma subunit
MSKPKVAFFDFACCEGCQLQVANLGEDLLDVLGAIDVVEFREVMSEKWDKDYDVAIIEGSITDEHAEKRIKKIRERSKVLVAYGSCAVIGGVNGMKNFHDLEEIGKYVYQDSYKFFPTKKTKAVHQVVKVDYFVPGCPIYLPEFVEILKDILRGLPHATPDHAVCVECKLNENVCHYEKGITCLGPVTRAGCNSWCINNNNICYGCRGQVSDPNKEGGAEVMKKYNLTPEDLTKRMGMYNKCKEEDKNGK